MECADSVFLVVARLVLIRKCWPPALFGGMGYEYGGGTEGVWREHGVATVLLRYCYGVAPMWVT